MSDNQKIAKDNRNAIAVLTTCVALPLMMIFGSVSKEMSADADSETKIFARSGRMTKEQACKLIRAATSDFNQYVVANAPPGKAVVSQIALPPEACDQIRIERVPVAH